MKPINLYDSVQQKKLLIDTPKLTIYNCGPTVYNDIHLGNLRPAIVFDLLVRFCRAINMEVVYVHNITDIDDKIIQKAQELKQPESVVAQTYTEAYLQIMDAMNLTPPNHMPKVSDHIAGMIDYVGRILATDKGYIQNHNVLFDVNQIPNYGVISKQNLDQLVLNVRDTNQTTKQNQHDFVLWKQTTTGLNWSTPWCVGRPGWHTECAYFIERYFGSAGVDIHGGGMDLKFPHHENENAQHQALHDRPIAKFWMHIGTVLISGNKMSKSLNNFVLVKELLNSFNPNALRLYFFQVKYQQPLNFEWALLGQVQTQFHELQRSINAARSHLVLLQQTPLQICQLDPEFVTHMSNDLNLPNVWTWLINLKNQLNTAIKNQDTAQVMQLLIQLEYHLSVLGFVIDNIHTADNIAKLQQWQLLLIKKDYEQADVIRAELMALQLI